MHPWIISLALSASFAAAGDSPPPDSPVVTTGPASKQDVAASPKFLKVVENKGKSIALQIASRTYVHGTDNGPPITLVGVAHIGDRSFYRALEKQLSGFDRVLYESVKPPGTGGAGGDTSDERIESTMSAMRFVAGLVESHRAAHGSYPSDLAALEAFAASKDPRVRDFLKVAMIDAWGRPLQYQPLDTGSSAQPNDPSYRLTSLGADGRTGGQGEDADVDLSDQPPAEPLELGKDDNLQMQLADALDLEFQLEAMDYDRPNFRCSDMAMDEVNRRLQAHGIDFEVIGGTLAGSSLPAKVVSVMLGLMKFADAMLEGAIADTFKVVMIEVLADPQVMDQGLAQFGKGFGDVIINDRNQIVIDDLKRVLDSEPEVKSVAVFYGAGHMADMADRLATQLGYVPAEGPEAEQWNTAIQVDLTASAIPPQEINKIRVMIRQMMRQQLRGR